MKLVKIKSYWSREGLKSNMTGVLIQRGNWETDIFTKRTTCEDEDNHLSDKERGFKQIYYLQS